MENVVGDFRQLGERVREGGVGAPFPIRMRPGQSLGDVYTHRRRIRRFHTNTPEEDPQFRYIELFALEGGGLCGRRVRVQNTA